jgi:hypothetical protein
MPTTKKNIKVLDKTPVRDPKGGGHKGKGKSLQASTGEPPERNQSTVSPPGFPPHQIP